VKVLEEVEKTFSNVLVVKQFTTDSVLISVVRLLGILAVAKV
jgi:hypothetical protein